MSKKLLSKRIAEKPIKVPGNPFWNVFKRFGRDEAIAMVINVLGTAIIALFATNPLLLSVAGPVIEKIGFFPAHIKEALGVYKTTPKKSRKSRSYYLKRAFKGGLTSLVEDLLVHDPIYIGLMFVGLTFYSGIPVWLLSAVSFVIAVLIVSVLEVGVTEARYLLFKKRLKRAGFGITTYYESRFFISTHKNPNKILAQVAKEFNLSHLKPIEYHDKYFGNKLPVFSGRVPKIRLRLRKNQDGTGLNKTAQIIYTRAYEQSKRTLEQYRYFPIKKDKIYFRLKQRMPQTLERIKNVRCRRILKRRQEEESVLRVDFTRIAAHDDELLVSIDKLPAHSSEYILEIKVYKNIKRLIEAMRFVMREFPVVQTTKGKPELEH